MPWHGEQRGVDAVGARWNDRDLRAALAAALKKHPRVLERIAFDAAREHTAVFQRMAVARFHDADGVLTDRDELLQRHDVLPRPEAEVETRRERIGLKPRFAVERDDRACRAAFDAGRTRRTSC